MGKTPTSRKSLTLIEKEAFFDRHLPHRLTLLRAFRHRETWGGDWQGKGDIFRCLEESALISIRLFINALGLRGKPDGSDYNIEPCSLKDKKPDDVWVDDLGGKLVTEEEIDKMLPGDRALLGALYCWANKELAHLTMEFATQYHDKHGSVRRGIDIIEELLRIKLYSEVGKQLPPITLG